MKPAAIVVTVVSSSSSNNETSHYCTRLIVTGTTAFLQISPHTLQHQVSVFRFTHSGRLFFGKAPFLGEKKAVLVRTEGQNTEKKKMHLQISPAQWEQELNNESEANSEPQVQVQVCFYHQLKLLSKQDVVTTHTTLTLQSDMVSILLYPFFYPQLLQTALSLGGEKKLFPRKPASTSMTVTADEIKKDVFLSAVGGSESLERIPEALNP